MKDLPNPTIALVDRDGRATSQLQGLMPEISALDVVVDGQGRPTTLFLARLQATAATPLPNASVPLMNRDGTPTRVMTAILMGMP